MNITAEATKQARQLSGADIGKCVLDSEGEPWRIVEIHHYPSGTCVEIHHPKIENWATSEPGEEVEYVAGESVTVVEG